jgi:hypothetical protein
MWNVNKNKKGSQKTGKSVSSIIRYDSWLYDNPFCLPNPVVQKARKSKLL